MASKIATETFEWLYVCNNQLKIDYVSVYSYVFRGKEHIEAIKMTLDHYVRYKSNMALNMAANTSIYSTFHSNLMISVSILSFPGDNEHI